TTANGAYVNVTNGLTLNGTAQLGDTAGINGGQLVFSGSQTLGGTGTVVFGGPSGISNALQVAQSGTTLTLGPALRVHGNEGNIASTSRLSDPPAVNVVNQGTLPADPAGGTIHLIAQGWRNDGSIQVVAGAGLEIRASTDGSTGGNTGLIQVNGSA